MNDCGACEVMPSGWRGCWIRFKHFSLERWLYRALAERDCGNDGVPLTHRTLYVDERGQVYQSEQVHSDTLTPHGKEQMSIMNVFSFLNDSFEIGIGWPNKWHCILRREAIHRFIWWYLRQWAFGEWFGLRRAIWYWLLSRSVARTRAHSHLV